MQAFSDSSTDIDDQPLVHANGCKAHKEFDKDVCSSAASAEMLNNGGPSVDMAKSSAKAKRKRSSDETTGPKDKPDHATEKSKTRKTKVQAERMKNDIMVCFERRAQAAAAPEKATTPVAGASSDSSGSRPQ